MSVVEITGGMRSVERRDVVRLLDTVVALNVRHFPMFDDLSAPFEW